MALQSLADGLDSGARHWLLVDLDAPGPDAGEAAALAAWLQRQPCPVIGVGAGDAPLAAGVDAVAQDRDLDRILANIERCPRAAAVLVQLLRATESLPVPEALTVESLAYAALQGGSEFARWLGAAVRRPPPPEAGPPVLLVRAGNGLEIVLNRPAARNAIGVEIRDALCEAFELVLMDEDIVRAHVRGNGACFSVGGELAEFGQAPDPAQAHAIRMLRLPARLVARAPERFEFHLHGACIGAGIELPSFGARVVAARRSFFQLPELSMGLIPGAGGCVGIARRTGRRRTAWMVLSGRRVDARTALAWGLVDALVD